MSATLERVVVIGSSCAGKTTFAAQLASALGHPPIALDELFCRTAAADARQTRVA